MPNLKELLAWFITSSSDPKKTSLAVIGFLTFFSGYALQAIQIACTFGLACLPIDNATLTDGINAIGAGVEALSMLAGAFMFFVGLYRKYNLGRWTAAQ